MNGLNKKATSVLPPIVNLPPINRPLTISLVTLGISKYAANALGDVIYVELPEISLEVSSGDAVGAVESVKSASDIITPVSGKVVETNATLEEKPKLLNEEPEGAGWVAKIEVEGDIVGTGEGLMSVEEYVEFTGEEES
jgi:glycine cleavage system H protein